MCATQLKELVRNKLGNDLQVAAFGQYYIKKTLSVTTGKKKQEKIT